MSPSRLLWGYALRYPVWVTLTLIMSFSSAIFNGVSTALIVPLILGVLNPGSLDLEGGPPIIQKTLSFLSGGEGNGGLALIFTIVILAIILKNVATYTTSVVSSALSKRLVNDIRKSGLKLILEVDIDFFVKRKIGDIINQVNNEVGRAANSIRTTINILTNVLTILMFVAILLSISWQLTLASTFLLVVLAFINQYFITRAKRFGKALSDKSRAYSSVLLEILTGIRLIKSVSNEEREYKRIEKLIDERELAEFQSQSNFAALGPINEVSGILAILVMVFLGKAFLLRETPADSLVGVLGTYLFLLNRLLPVVGSLNGQRSQLANLSSSTEVVADFLRRDDKPFMVNGQKIYQNLSQGIRCENVSFAYPGQEDLVLKNVDLYIPKGTTLALVGTSGAGKSTLADLFPRFYEPIEGAIKIDDNNLKDYDIASLRQAMGIVSQDTFLFNASVHDNLAYGLEKVTEEDIIGSAKRANAYEFIMNLPQGFDTEIGERGVMLSGGQRQRIAIARALLRNPDILILDEATSALDTVSERLVQQAIDELCRERTTVVIAHRLSTIQRADQIAVMEKGQVMEVGTHEQLLQKGGHYHRLYTMQFEKGSDNAVSAAVSDALIQTSYEIRTRLNPMIGFLQLVVDNLVDSSEESHELTQEAYNSAVRLLKTLEFLEERSKKAKIA